MNQAVRVSVRVLPPPERATRQAMYLAVLAGCASLAAFLWYFRHDAILLYGDATAHINIARRVFDSRRPGPFQLGTVWLPLPHVLMLPFVISHWMWRTGFGASIPSMIAYVAGVVGVFRLVRAGTRASDDTLAAQLAAWCAALVYGANPNLLYLQATAMTEPLYLAFFIWAAVFFCESVQQARALETLPLADASLLRCGWMLLGAMLCRYDGWFAALVFTGAALALKGMAPAPALALQREPRRRPFKRFLLVVAAAPVFWFAWNLALWGNPLEFATGPYSARAIEQRSSTGSGFHHAGYHDARAALRYFIKDAKLNLAGGDLRREYGREPRLRLQNLWLVLAAAGTLLVLIFMRRLWPWLLLWSPLPFYVLSIAWGGVPIFMPVWWPFSYYNVRYGLALLPAFAVLSAAVIYFVGRAARSRLFSVVAALGFLALVVASYLSTWRAEPICLREARANSATRLPFELKLAAELKSLSPDSTLLMYTASNVGALQRAGIPLRRTINETHARIWKRALLFPAASADYLVASDDDPVAKVARDHVQDFEPLTVIDMPGQAHTVIYRKRLH